MQSRLSDKYDKRIHDQKTVTVSLADGKSLTIPRASDNSFHCTFSYCNFKHIDPSSVQASIRIHLIIPSVSSSFLQRHYSKPHPESSTSTFSPETIQRVLSVKTVLPQNVYSGLQQVAASSSRPDNTHIPFPNRSMVSASPPVPAVPQKRSAPTKQNAALSLSTSNVASSSKSSAASKSKKRKANDAIPRTFIRPPSAELPLSPPCPDSVDGMILSLLSDRDRPHDPALPPINHSPSDLLNIKTEIQEIQTIVVPAHAIGRTYDILSDSDRADTPHHQNCLPSIPGPSDVLEHPDIPLRKLGIYVNTDLKCVVCVSCSQAINPEQIYSHLHKEMPHMDISRDISSKLIDLFDLPPLSDVAYPTSPVHPVFGIPISSKKMYFCSQCHRGYSKPTTLQSHQRDSARCPGPNVARSSYLSFAQTLLHGRARYFPVSAPQQQNASQLDFVAAFKAMQPPLVDYSQIPMQNVDDRQNINHFLYREQWDNFVQGLTPDDILEACRLPGPSDGSPLADKLGETARLYLGRVNTLIGQTHSFGICREIASVYSLHHAQAPVHTFNSVTDDTVAKYARMLTRLLFAVIRSMDPDQWMSKAQYPPLALVQRQAFAHLVQVMSEHKPESECILAFHKACFELFAHEKQQYCESQRHDKFFSPVNCFAVYVCVRRDGTFEAASNMTGNLATLEYSIRSAIFLQVRLKASETKKPDSQILADYKKYLDGSHDTPMAFLYNTHILLKVIRANEVNVSHFSFTQPDGCELSYDGHRIHLSQVKLMIEQELTRYHMEVQQLLFFQETVPDSCLPAYEIEDLVDNLHSFAVGYSFIDDPRNNFEQYRTVYGEWLLSDPSRRHLYVYECEGRLVWKPAEAHALLSRIERCRRILAVGSILSTVLICRGAEFARMLWRNDSGSPRNLRLEYKVLSFVSIADKTSHRTIRDLYVPHVLTREWATQLINHLAIFRPFEEFLVQLLMDEKVVHRYRFDLWPGLHASMTPEQVGTDFAKVTEKYLGVSMTFPVWRAFTTALSDRLPQHDLKEYCQNYVHETNMHSTSMAIARYGLSKGNAPGTDYRAVLGSVLACDGMQKLIGIGQTRPFLHFQRAAPSSQPSTLVSAPPFQLDVTRTFTENLVPHMMREIRSLIDGRVNEAITQNMAEMLVTYFPKPVRPYDDERLRPASDIAIHPSRLTQLRQFLGIPGAQFTCPEQALLFDSLIQRQQSVLAILGTNKGKTMTILMYARLYYSLRGITVIILPLSSLHGDLRRRAASRHVKVSQWTPDGAYDGDVHVITVSIEHQNFDAFEIFLRQLHAQNRLNLVVFDEIHKILTDRNYRPCFENFDFLKTIGVPIIGLTGTMPPSLLGDFQTYTRMSWKIIRTSSVRPELRYEVRPFPTQDQTIRALIADAQRYITSYQPADRMMIFCRTRSDADTIAEQLSVPAYTSTTESNPAAMKNWLLGQNKIMVATSILGVGLDYSHVRHVLHYQNAYSMLDQHQQESRAGRDGSPADAITYSITRRQPPESGDFGTRELHQWTTETVRCLRIIPSSYLDGVAITCILLPGCQLCRNCELQMNQTAPNKPERLPPVYLPIRSSDTVALASDQHPAHAVALSNSTNLHGNHVPQPRPSLPPPASVAFASPQIAQPPSFPVLNINDRSSSVFPTPNSTLGTGNIPSAYSPLQFPPRGGSVPQPMHYQNTPSNPFASRPVSTSSVGSSGLMVATDHHRTAALAEFIKKDITDPLYDIVRQLLGVCLYCTLGVHNGDPSTHHSDYCPGPIGHYQKDQNSKHFRNALRFPVRTCYGCGLSVPHQHHGNHWGKTCPYAGIVSTLLYISLLRARVPCLQNAPPPFELPFIVDDALVTQQDFSGMAAWFLAHHKTHQIPRMYLVAIWVFRTHRLFTESSDVLQRNAYIA